MSQNVQSGNTSITGSAEVEIDKKSITATISDEAVAVATTTFGTVPANKVWRIIMMHINADAGSNIETRGTILLNGVESLSVYAYTTATDVKSITQAIVYDYACCPVLAAGQTVAVSNSSAGSKSRANVSYVEEDA